MSLPELPSGTLKRREGEPVFQEPWNAQVLALADLMVQRRTIAPTEWAEALGAEVSSRIKAGDPDDAHTFFEAALAALEGLLVATGSLSRAELNERCEDWEHAYLHTPHGQPVELHSIQHV